MLTYAQNFEDVMLERLFKEVKIGFYVDIGAWDPTAHSVTRHFYDRGWRGVNVEPITARCRLFDAERPRDVNLNKATGPKAGKMIFYECLEESYLSTLDSKVATAMRERGLTVEEHRVEVVTLDSIFETHCPQAVEFLKIDVEGFEGELLKGFDLSRYRPRLLVVEATIPGAAPLDFERIDEIGTWQEWEPRVLAQNYCLAHFDGLNRFYLRNEDAGLAGRLRLPPGVFDMFENAAVVEQIASLTDSRAAKDEVIERLLQELEAIEHDRASKQAVIQRLMTDLAAKDADRAAKDEVIGRLEQEQAAVEQDRSAKQAAVERLMSEHAAKDSDRTAKDAVIKRLEQEVAAVEQDRSAKQAVVERLMSEHAAKDAVIERLERKVAAVEQDRATKQVAVERLTSDDTVKDEVIGRLEQELAAKQVVVERFASGQAANDSRTNELARRLRGKDQVLALTSGTLVDYRRSLGGALEVAFRSRHKPGRIDGGGRYYGSQRADSATRRRIGMDVMSIQFGVSGGVEVYMRTLVQSLFTLEGVGVVLLCLGSQLEDLRRTFGDKVAYYVYARRPLMKMAKLIDSRIRRKEDIETKEAVPASFNRLRDDAGVHILHCPLQCYSLFDFNVPAVFHLHDLQHLHFPENFLASDVEARNHYYGLSADLSDIVVATSDYIRDDIVSKMHVPTSKVVRIPATWDPKVEAGLSAFSPADARRTYRLPPSFGLFPAQFWPHKNHARLVEALAIVRSRLPDADFKLVFTGNRAHSGWPKVEATIERLRMHDHVLCLDYVPVEHLAAIYKCAKFCVMPSTFEASSYPVIEAQLFGCPAMCSNVTSLPELIRDGAGLLFDATDVDDIAAQMLRWLRDPADAAAHAERASGKVRREHSMESYSTCIAEVYQRMVPL